MMTDENSTFSLLGEDTLLIYCISILSEKYDFKKAPFIILPIANP